VPAIITPKDNPAEIHSLQDLTKPGIRAGVGNPETVCLGLYGVELLEKNGLFEDVMSNVVTFGASCSKTANLVAMNKVDAILGWRVFHFWNSERMDYVPISPEQIPRISYIPISIPVYTKDINLSKMFIDFVLSRQGRKIYEKFGYITVEDKAEEFAPQATIGGEYVLSESYFDFMNNRWRKK
jgi:molybdate transport system substrate-binding protein